MPDPASPSGSAPSIQLSQSHPGLLEQKWVGDGWIKPVLKGGLKQSSMECYFVSNKKLNYSLQIHAFRQLVEVDR